MWLQHLDSEMEDDDPRKEYLDEMKQGLSGFMGMLGSLKEYYKTPVLDLSHVDLNLLVNETLPFVKEKIDKKSVIIEKLFDSKLPDIEGDEEKLKSVILNLLLNAIDSVAEKGKIEIATRFFNEKVTLEIKDNGKGIAEEDLSRIFYPFYSTKSGGSGLGLAISSNIISAHKGRIEVKSEIGKGTTFRIFFNKNLRILPTNSTNGHYWK